MAPPPGMYSTGIDRNKDAFNWNKVFEAHIKERFTDPAKTPLNIYFATQMAEELLAQRFLHSLNDCKRLICKIQADIAFLLHDIHEMNKKPFQAIWKSVDPPQRWRCILHGLVISCGVTSDMEQWRQNCPESTLEWLERRNGQGFIDLVKAACPKEQPDRTIATEPNIVPNKAFDLKIEAGVPCPPDENPKSRAVYQKFLTYTRNHFLSLFIYNTIMVATGRPPKYDETVGRTEAAADEIKAMKKLAKLEGWSKESTQEALRAVKEVRQTSDWTCDNCRKPEKELGEGRKFLQCSKCKAIGRKVVYCDKDCQVNHWKRGDPPHKTTCGKVLDIPDDVKEAVTDFAEEPKDGFPPKPDPGIKWSPALLKQINRLRKDRNIDYMVFGPSQQEPDDIIEYGHPTVKGLFRNWRDKAMQTLDPQYVGMILKQLSLEAKDRNPQIPIGNIINQLYNEYRTPKELLRSILDLPMVKMHADEIEELQKKMNETNI